jgi:aldehyde:ferredoxin oxidoreductase
LPALDPEQFLFGNMGAFIGSELKSAGFDGVVVHGRVDKPSYLLIEDGKAEIRGAASMWGLDSQATQDALKAELGKRVRIICTGPAGEHLARVANVVTSTGSSGSAGFGAVMGSKNLKAIAIRGTGKVAAARPDELKKLRTHAQEVLSHPGTHVYRNATNPGAELVRYVRCHGCPIGCWRALYRASTGEEAVTKCQAQLFYIGWDQKYHGGKNTEGMFHATNLANRYSLCTMALAGMCKWLEECYTEGVLSEKDTGLPLDKIGSLEFIEALVRKVAYKEGFGDQLAGGVARAAREVGGRPQELSEASSTRHGFGIAYGPRALLTTSLIYATEPRPAVAELHEVSGLMVKWSLWYTTGGTYSYLSTDVLRSIARRFWGSEEAADFSTYEGKPLAAFKIQNRQVAKECLVVCDFAWPITDMAHTEDHVGDPTLESQILSAVLGQDYDEAALNRVGERVFNLQRAILLRDGWKGREGDTLPEVVFNVGLGRMYDAIGMFNPECELPAGNGKTIKRQGMTLDRDAFEKMKDAYYKLRGWDPPSGLQTRELLDSLDLGDIASTLKSLGLLAS